MENNNGCSTRVVFYVVLYRLPPLQWTPLCCQGGYTPASSWLPIRSQAVCRSALSLSLALVLGLDP